jgi:uncharacterized protein
MIRTVVLLLAANVFMSFAWYGHLRHPQRALWLVIVVSWGIAFFEYCLQVPANRIGYAAGLSGAELKTLQEVITLGVFIVFAALYLREPIRWNTVAGFALIGLGATLVFAPWARKEATAVAATGGIEAVVETEPGTEAVQRTPVEGGAPSP